MFSKCMIEKAPNVLCKRRPRHFEVEQSAISLPLLEAYDQRIHHLCTENEQLQGEKMEDVKIMNGQAAELAERRAEVFQLRQELQLLRDEVGQSRLAVNPEKNSVKFNVSRKSYWDVGRAARSLKRKKSETTSEMLQRSYQWNLNQSRYISLRNFLGNCSVLCSPVAAYSFHVITKESV